MQKKTLKALVYELAEKVIEVKKIKVLVGKNKKPLPKEGEIIFHIDI
jgi:hypothetical protein